MRGNGPVRWCDGKGAWRQTVGVEVQVGVRIVFPCLCGIASGLGTGWDPKDQWGGMGTLGQVRLHKVPSPEQSFWGHIGERSHVFFQGLCAMNPVRALQQRTVP